VAKEIWEGGGISEDLIYDDMERKDKDSKCVIQ
jgi:hypothetical protein